MTYFNPLLVVISGPSGVGKDVLIEKINSIGENYHFTITTTTRPIRLGEKNGVNHNFVTKVEFEKMKNENKFLEWAKVYGNFYAVPKKQIINAIKMRKHVLVRVDMQGANRIRSIVKDSLHIFILPPSIKTLRNHLLQRGVNDDADMERRLSEARKEMDCSSDFDYSVINIENQLEHTAHILNRIIEKESQKLPPRKIFLD
ncbi:MAG: guanylate kinase [Dehalococcoidia bacterium]|nr:guanylate kinase [Dehalococcoidia bacterium]MDP7231424.1 guanylate kinase [Dehalococcoidia bacterium]MDP7613447.1 guanylate kinase [Dehalococcoidia bacterium]